MPPAGGAFAAFSTNMKDLVADSDSDDGENDAAAGNLCKHEKKAINELKKLRARDNKRELETSDKDADRDEAGFLTNEDDPLQYISKEDHFKKAGEEHMVFHKRIAIRKKPNTEAQVLGSLQKRDKVKLYDWDESRTWRQTYFTLQGGHGGTVVAWVMVKHPDLGQLLKPYVEGMEVPDEKELQALAEAEEAAAKAQEAAKQAAAAAAKVAELKGTAKTDEAVAEGNMRVLSFQEVADLAKSDKKEASPNEADGEDDDEEDDIEIPGLNPSQVQELVQDVEKGCKRFKVVHESFMAIREQPSAKAKIVGSAEPGTSFDTFGTVGGKGQWVRVYGQVAGTGEFAVAFMMKEHGQLGKLLEEV